MTRYKETENVVHTHATRELYRFLYRGWVVGIEKVVNKFKDFSRPNIEIKYFSRTLTEFKDFSRQLVKFLTFSRIVRTMIYFTDTITHSHVQPSLPRKN